MTHIEEVVPTAEQFDIVVIGGGPGGYATALYGGNAGLRVAVVEKDKVGGTCLHRGCIPAKEFLETAHVFRTVSTAKEHGVMAEQPTVDFATSQARKNKVVEGLWKGLQALMKSRKIATFIGTGVLGADRMVTVTDSQGGTTELQGTHVVLASGSVPRTIPGFEIDGRLVMTSDEVLALDKLPGSAVVIGGGAIGLEFASMMSDLGTQVTVLEALPQILAGVDKDIAAVVAKSFKTRGIEVRAGVAVKGHTPNPDGAGTTVMYGEGEQVTVDSVVVSVGRRPLSESLGLQGTGVKVNERGFVEVDNLLHTGEPGVYAVGDVIAVPDMVHPALAHVGFAEGMVVVKDILGEDPVPVDYARVPWAIYCHPEVAFAGLSEDAAKAAGYDVIVKKMPFAHNGRAMIVGDTEGMVKVIAERARPAPEASSSGPPKGGRILGVHMVGPWVTEQLGQGYMAVNWEATTDEIAQFIQPHPSLSEQFGEAVLALTGRGLHG